jgi:Na+/melibiose symporter-like transporter
MTRASSAGIPSGLYPRVGLFSAILASAGLPLYIHLPSFAARDYGMDLATLGAVLITIRLMDLVQDPALGWMVDRFAHRRLALANLGRGGLALGVALLFELPPLLAPVGRMLLARVVVFTSYSLLQILFYGQSVLLAGAAGDQHLRLAGWREAGLLAGVLIAASAPQLLIAAQRAAPYRDFGLLLIALIAACALLTPMLWRPRARPASSGSQIAWRRLMQPAVLWLLALGLLNALPVALSSTLFVFFVEDQLQIPQLTGLFLILFFVAAGVAAPLWSRAARHWGPRNALFAGMILAIVGFGWAANLPAGSTAAFAVVCLASGAALAADMVILPAAFATVLGRMDLPEGLGFSLWTFAAKLALTLAAAVALPALAWAGYDPTSTQTPQSAALNALALAYALIPCLLKLLAIAWLFALPKGLIDGRKSAENRSQKRV